MTLAIDFLGSQLIRLHKNLRFFFTMCFHAITNIFQGPIRWKETLQQLHFVANGSVFIIIFCVCFAAVVTILESSFHMKLVIQNDSMVPGFAALLILRELGAVVTALLLTSRVGAGFAAEIGSMQVTEQIDALKMLGIEPVNYLVVPRLIASVLGCMFLVAIANSVCLLCSLLVSEVSLGYTSAIFFAAMKRFVEFKDFIFALIKGAVFGAVIPLMSCYFGFLCKPGADGVGKATTQSVVFSSIGIIVLDFVLSYTFSYLY